ncbi:MAG TPA: c-type cytochrome [Acidimicrobiia bacterium]|nr:c-type cytochrome [Acidimicrobiia bacterium]
MLARRLVVAVVVVAPAVLLLAATAFAGPGKVRQAEQPSAEQVERGRQLYLTSCSSCHGAEGEGTSIAPSLIGVGAAAADFQLTTGRMPLTDPNAQAVRKPPAFDRNQIDDIVAYVASLGSGPPIPEVNPDAGSLSEGANLFLNNCAACHSAAGVGGALSYGNDAPDLHHATAEQIAEAIRTGPGQMPVFGPDTFSDHQVNSIVRYVRYLREPDDPGGFSLGRIGPITEGMVALLIGIPVLLFVCRRIEEAHERASRGGSEST